MTAEQSNPDVIRYLASGTLGERAVLQALTDVPMSRMRALVLPHFGLRVQRLEDIRQDDVREDLEVGWNKTRGIPFYGALTLVPAEDESATANVVELPADKWHGEVRPRLEAWNYHANGWFGFREIPVPGESGLVTCVTEVLSEDEVLHPLPRNFRAQMDYRLFANAMREAVLRYRRVVERSLT